MFRPLLAMALAFTLAWVAAPLSIAAAPSSAASWAEVRQTQIPAYRARAEAAKARAEALQAYLKGALPLAAALPELPRGALGSPASVAGRLSALDGAILAREAERRQPFPELGSRARADQLRALRSAALAAEEAADGLERRILLGVQAHLRANPSMTDKGLAPTFKAIADAEAAAEAAFAAAGQGDPEAREAAAQARMRLEAERDRLEMLRETLRDLSLVPSASPPDPAPELEALKDPDRAPEALARLRILRPFLGAAEAARVEEVLVAYLQSGPLTKAEAALADAKAAVEAQSIEPSLTEGAIPELEVALEQAAQRVSAASAALEALGPPGNEDAVATTERRVRTLKLEAATTHLGMIRARLSAAQDHHEAQQTALRQQVEEAKAKAEETELAALEAAQQAAEQKNDAQAAINATLLTDLHAAQKTAEDLWSQGEEMQEAYQARLTEASGRVVALSAGAGVAQQMGPLDPRRVPEIDRIHRELRDVIEGLRSLATELGRLTEDGVIIPGRAPLISVGEGCGGEDSDLALLPATAGTQDLPEELTEEQAAIVEKQQDAIAEQLRARAHATQALLSLRDQTLGLLGDAKELRREVAPDISARAQAQERSYRLQDLRQEARFTLPNLLSLVRSRIRAFLSLPSRLTDPTWLWEMVKGSLQILFLAFVWLWLHRKSDQIASRLLQSFSKVRRGRFGQLLSLEPLKEPVEQVVRASTDLLAGAILVEPMAEAFPEVGLLILFYLQFALFRLFMGGFDLIIARYTDMRPSLISLSDETFTRLRRTSRLVLIWVIARQATLYFTVRILGADAMSQIATTLFNLALLALILVLLHRWEPLLRRQMRRYNATGRLGLTLKHPPASQLIRAPRALLMLILLGGQSLNDLLQGRLDPQSSLGRLMVALNRYRMGQVQPGTPEELPPPPQEVLDALMAPQCAPGCFIPRPAADDGLTGAIKDWRKEKRRGLVAIVGEGGSGKRAYLDHVEVILHGDPYPVLRAPLTERLLTEAAMLRWLCEVAQLPPGLRTPQAVMEALIQKEPHLFILESVHFTFLRRVGGFEALRVLLYVLNGASKQHFFVLSCHGQAFSYLSRLGSLVNTQVFRTVIHLQPFGESQLRDLVERRVEAAGYKPDYRWLAPSQFNPTGEEDGGTSSERGGELDRMVSVFFGVLADASMGCPQVALELWSRCLVQGKEPGTVGVQMGDVLKAEGPTGLGDPELFTLAALRVQQHLTESELSEVINMPPGVVRAIVRDLDSRGLTVTDPRHHIAITQANLPGISRLLKRRHFLQG